MTARPSAAVVTERSLDAIGGTLQILSAPREGTSVTGRVPVLGDGTA